MGRQRERCWAGLALLIFISLLSYSASLAQAPGRSVAKDKIRVGFSMSLTGIYAAGAESQMNSYQLWTEQVNKKGGIPVKELGKRLPVELLYYDDKSSTETAVRIYEKLITQDKVDLLLSPWGTTIHFAIAPLAEKYRVPLIGSTAASVKLRELKTKYFWFVTSCLPDRQSKTLVELLKSQKVKSVAIIYIQELFPRENLEFLRPYLTKEGFQLVLVKDYPVGVRDLAPLLMEVKAKKPDALLALTYPADAFLLTTQAKEVGLNPKFMLQLVGPAIAGYYEKFGPATEGIVTQGHWSPKAPWPGAKEFNQAYKARFGKRPDYLDSIESYIEVQILEQAIEHAGTLNWEKLRNIIAAHEFMTIGGPIKFTGPENLRTPSMWLQWQKGELEIVWPKEVATAKLLFPKPAWR